MNTLPAILKTTHSLCVLAITIFTNYEAAAQELPTLCKSDEQVVISFEISKLRKMTSVCEGLKGSYLIYRFGTQNAVELEFPPTPHHESWSKFQYSGYFRGGGIQNDGMGEYMLIFSNGDSDYSVIQNWRLQTDEYNVGVLVEAPTGTVVLHGDRSTQSGSLELLNGNKNIKNIWAGE